MDEKIGIDIGWLFKFGPLLALASALALHPGAAAGEMAPEREWVRLIYLYTDSCRPCRLMSPVVRQMSRTYAGRVQIVEIDAEKDAAAVRRYGVRAVPTLIFFDRNHQEVFRRRGYTSENQIREQLKKMGVED